MSASETPSGTAAAKPPATLSARAFPRRARRLLEGILEYASDELERTLAATLDDVEQQLFKLAEQARSNEVQQHCFEALRTVKRGRSDLTPRFMIGLEAALASIRDPDAAKGRDADDTGFGDLALVDVMDADESAALREIASRMEIRNSLPLYLLGQRFGVLAGQPAFDPEHLPVGPHVLCHILADAARCLDLSPANRLVVFRQFDRQITPVFGGLIEAINTLLIREGVLPHLSFVPVRGRAADARRGAGRARADQSGETAPVGSGTPAPAPAPAPAAAPPPAPRLGAVADAAPTPLTGWPNIEPPVPLAAAGGENTFSVLRDLLASRRALLGKLGQGPAASAAKPKEHLHVVSEDDVQSVLGVLQHKASHAVLVNGQPAPRSVTHVKQDLLSQLRQIAPEGKAPALAEEDTDTIDLVGMLFDVLMRDVKPNSPAATLLAKLQVPLLRVALRDKDFFTQQRHPARQMLNAVAESGTFWLGEDDGDSGTVEKMQMLVDRVVGEFNGDLNIFDTLLQDLGGHLQTLARKAEVSERRHVDAARGKEKLALARLRASEEVAERLKGHKVPRFVKTLLTEAWADVLALSLLRQGEDSAAYKQQLAVAEQLIDAARADKGATKPRSASQIEALRHEIEHSLCQVGYHAEDAQAIANRLSQASEPESADDPASRTELALRLKARSRLGADVEPKQAAKPAEPLSTEETAAIEQIKQLPFGTWFEFSDTPSGERVRRRMSWFSTLTGHVLFVNHRGQRVGEHTLQTLAHAMASGTAQVVVTQRSTLIDRAWNSIVSALKSFAGKPALAGDAA